MAWHGTSESSEISVIGSLCCCPFSSRIIIFIFFSLTPTRIWRSPRVSIKCDIIYNCHEQHSRHGCSDTISLHVSDISIFCGSSTLNTLEHWLQVVINWILLWALLTASSLSPKPNVCTLFASAVYTLPLPSILDLCLPFVPSFEFLGLTFDIKLSWEPHLQLLQHVVF